MGAETGIAWTNRTWNPWQGCTKVSPACANCYMFRDKLHYGQDPETVVRSKPPTFNAPLKWPQEPALVFTCSWSDWFHVDADEWRPEAWEIVKRTPWLTYQILTKRPERIIDHLPPDWGCGYPNVWLGVSVENQRFDWRAAVLCTIPAHVRFVSAEPLIGPLSLMRVNPHSESYMRRAAEDDDRFIGLNVLEWPRHPPLTYTPTQRIGKIDWVIVGGESGTDDERREMKLEWAADLRDQCRRNGTAFFFKQVSARRSGVTDGVPPDLLVQEFPELAP